MKLYLATLYQIKEMEYTSVGVFSTADKAITAGESAICSFLGREPVMHDWDHDGLEHRYFFDGFTLTITETELDDSLI